MAEYDGQDVPEVPLLQFCKNVHLPQAHLPADQSRQRHGGPERARGLGQRRRGLQLLLQARTLAGEHLGFLLAHGMNQLQSRSEGEIDWGLVRVSRGCA